MKIRPLSKELQERAIAELNEVPDRLQDDLDSILEWLRQQPHIKARTEDQWLVSFLRGCKFSLQRTKETLDMFYSIRTIAPYYFTSRNPFSTESQQFWKLGMVVMLPKDSNLLSPRRFLFVCKNGDPDKASIKDVTKFVLMLMYVNFYEDDDFVINGQEIFIDFKNIPYNYIGQFTPKILKTVVVMVEQAFPARIKGIHFINVSPVIQVVINTFLSFLTKKLRSRIHAYSESQYDALYQAVPRDVFPDEYGGNAGTVRELADKTRLKVESYKEWYKEDEKYCTDESKRPGKPRNADEFFNLEGSFRKLNVD